MNPLLTGLAIASALTLLPFAFRTWRRRRTWRRWTLLAPGLELSLSPAPERRLLAGRYRGHPVEVSVTRAGASLLRFTLAASMPEGFGLFPQGRGVRWRQGPESRDIQVGQSTLDAAFLIQGQNPAAVIRLLNEPAVRDSLLALQAREGHVRLSGQALSVTLRGSVTEEPCRELLRDLARLATALEVAADQHRFLADSARESARSEAPVIEAVQPLSARRDFHRLAEIRKEFGQRWAVHRALVVAGGLVGGLLGLGLWFALRRMPAPEGWDLSGLPFATAAVLAYATFQLSIHKYLLCPACGNDVIEVDADKLPMDSEGDTPAFILSTDRCPHCDIRLS